jgi:zinc protease
VHVKTVRENLPAVIELLGEMLREPAFAKKDFESLRAEMLSKMEEQLSDPIANASVALMQRLLPFPPDDVRYTPTVKESIERLHKVSAADLASLHKRLWGASSAQLSVVGDFDAAAVKADIAKAIATWKSPKAYQRIPLPFQASKSGDDTINTPDKEMAFVAAGQALEARDDDPAYPALYLFNYMLGGSPTSRLFLRLRQKEGISYGAFSQLLAHPIDKSAFFFAGAIAAPANMDQAMSGLLAEIESMVKTGVTDKELADAKKSYAKVWEGRIAEDDFVLGELNQGLFLGRTLDYWKDLNSKIDKLTVGDVNAAVKKFIDPEKLAKVRAGDLAKKK